MIKKLLPLMAFLLVVLLVYLQPYTLPVKAVFSNSSQITIDGIFSDWGTVSLPATGVYVCQDYSNTGESDGNGFTNKSSDIEYIRVAVSTSLGGSEIASPSNPIHDFYYRIDTLGSTLSPGQSYYLQLNLGAATPGYADHLLQFWANLSATPNVTIVLYEYDSPYPVMGAFTSGNLKGKVSNVSNPYPGFITDGGVHDTAASGAIGLYDGAHYAVEVKIPAVWYSSLYGGMVADDGTGVDVILSAAFTGTGTIGAVGTVKDTVNDSFGNTISIDMETTTGDTVLSRPYLTFITGPQTITAGYSSGIITIQLMDAFGYPKVVSSNTNIALVSSSASGYFDTSSIGAFDGSITQITLLAGSSSVSFYYKDTTAGDITIGVSENPSMGWTDAAQHELIIAGDAAILTLTPTTGSAVVGNDFNLTATVTDSYGNPVSGSVIDWHSASLTASFIYYDAATDIEGLAHAVVSEITSGDSVFNATVNGYPLVTGSSTISWLSAAPAVLVVTDGLGNPIASPQTAGTAFTVMVKAYDRYGNVATSYNGSAYLSDLSGTLDITLIDFSGGVWTHDVTITKAYYHDHITATCVIVGCLSGTSNPFDVVAGSPHHITLTPESATNDVNTDHTLEGTIYDQYDNPVINQPVTWTITDGPGLFVSSEISTDNQGMAHAVITSSSAGITTITINPDGYPAVQAGATKTWESGDVYSFTISAVSSPQIAGVSFSIIVTAVDSGGTINPSYSGDVTLYDDTGTLSPITVTLVGGTGTISVVVTQAYVNNYITATDGVVYGVGNLFDVIAGDATILTLTPTTGSAVVGNNFNLTATVTDSYGNPVSGSVIDWHSASLTASFIYYDAATDIEGLAHAVVSEITSGDSVFNATVNGYPLVTGSSTISWLSAAPAVLVVTDGLGNPIASPQTAGTAFTVMVKAYDRYGNVATSYNGSAYLSDLSGTLDITLIDFSGGVWTHDVTITKAYYHDHITATCVIVGCLSGTSNPFDVVAGDPVRLDLTPDSGTVIAGGLVTIEVTLYDEYDNIASGYTGTVRFLSTDVQAILPLDYTFTPDDEGKHRFSGEVIFKTAGTRIITAEDIAETNLVDTSSWSVNAAATAHFVSLPIYSHQTAGVPFSITILAVDEFGNQTDYNGDVTISDQSGTLTGFVISLSAGAGTADITITAAYLEDFISATDGDINGFSNNFDVVAAEPYILVLSPKIQMQTTGSPAILSAELYDQYGNPVPSQLISWSIASGPGKFTMSGGTTDTTISDTMGQSMLTLASGNAGLSRIVATSGVATDTANIVWNSPPFSTVVIPPETTTQGTTTSPTSVTPTAITSSSPATIISLPPTISTMPVTSTQPQNTNNQTSSVSTDLPVTVTAPPSSTSSQTDDNDAKQTGWLLALGITIGAVLSMLFLAYFKSGIYGEILCLPAMNPVSNAVVTLTNHKGKEVARFSTPADGKYHFRGLLPGEYQISVTGIACHSGKESSAQLTIRLFKSVIPKLFLYK